MMSDNKTELNRILCEIEEYKIELERAERHYKYLYNKISELKYKAGQLDERLMWESRIDT